MLGRIQTGPELRDVRFSRQGLSTRDGGLAVKESKAATSIVLPNFRQASVGRSDVSSLSQLDGIPSTHTNDLHMVSLRDTSVMACSLSYDTKTNRVHWKNFIHGNETFNWLIRALHSNRNKKEGITMHLR